RDSTLPAPDRSPQQPAANRSRSQPLPNTVITRDAKAGCTAGETSRRQELSRKYSFQLQGILRCESGLIVIKVDKDVLKLCAPGSDPAGPGFELLLAVVALVSTSRAVQAHTGKIGGHLQGRLKSRQLVNAQCRVVAAQGFVDRRQVPCGIAKLENIAMPSRE